MSFSMRFEGRPEMGFIFSIKLLYLIALRDSKTGLICGRRVGFAQGNFIAKEIRFHSKAFHRAFCLHLLANLRSYEF